MPSRAIPRYDIIVIDESQDINQILFSFVSKIIRDHYAQHKVSPQLMIIGINYWCYMKRHAAVLIMLVCTGDGNQCVYRFKGSDDRYLTLANKLFEDLQRPESSWNAFKLSISYRVTGNMALFVNKVMLNEKNLVAFKSAGPPVHYIVGSPYAAVEAIGHELISMIKKDFIKPSDVFLLNASLNSTNNKMPIRVLENMLSESGIPVYVPQGDEEALRVDVIEGKVALSTFHSVKGLERKVVVIFGFNLKYFSYYAKEEDPTRCPCPLYVAVTRATDMLCLIAEDQENEHLPFLGIADIVDYGYILFIP